MPQLDQLIAAIRQEATRPEYQVSAPHPMLPMAEIGQPAPPLLQVTEVGQAVPQQGFRHVDELLLISDSAQFVDAVYKALLRRPADALGAQTYREKLDQGYGQMFVLAALRASDEARLSPVSLAGFGLAPLVYNCWRVGRRIGLSVPARIISKAYSGWRQLRLAASGRLNSRIAQADSRLSLAEEQQRGLKALTGQRLDEAAHAREQLERKLLEAQDRLAQQLHLQEIRNEALNKERQKAQGIFEAENRFELQLLRTGLATLQQRALAIPLPSVFPVAAGSAETSVMLAQLQADLDAYYLAFENAHRGSHAEIIEKISPYLAKVAELPPEVRVLPMVDIGCGRGEWLELLGEQGFDAMGLDLSAAMVEHCRRLGLRVEHASGQQWLATQPDNAYALVSGFHIVEHLAFDQLFQLIAQIWRVLTPGGMLVLETPNPESVLVGSHTFYHDHTHRNPVTPTSLQFLLGYHGFVKQQVLRLNPYPDKDRVHEPGVLAERVNGHLYGPQDYGVVARKP